MNNEVIEMKIDEHDKKIEQHEDRIICLEKSDVKQQINIDSLCDKIDKLINQNNKWFYAMVTGMAGMLVKILFFK